MSRNRYYVKLNDKFKGCLLGGASGDALGYPVEFLKYEQIQSLYGRDGIQIYSLTDNTALISDNTQMTLYTANGILCEITDQFVNKSTKRID